MNIKKLSLLSLLLFACSLPISAMGKEDSIQNDNLQKKTTWRKWIKKHIPSKQDAILFTLGALYAGSRVWIDHSEPTFNGFLNAFGKRTLYGTVGSLLLPVAMNVFTSDTLKDEFIDIIRDPVLWQLIFASAAYREIYAFKRIPALSSIGGGLISFLVNGIIQTVFADDYSTSAVNGQIFGSLLGVGLRYRHDLGSGIKQTHHLIRQIPSWFHSAIKHMSFKNRTQAPAFG